MAVRLFIVSCARPLHAANRFPLYNGIGRTNRSQLANSKGGVKVSDYVQRFMENQGPLGPHPKHYTGGWIEVICGSMFSGKTEELIRRVRRAQIARQRVQVFKPVIDVRYAAGRVTSHSGQDYDARPCASSDEIARCIYGDTTDVAVDEAQFFDEGLIEVVEKLASH